MIEDSINIGDINVPTDMPQQSYHQRLESKRKELKKLLGEKITGKHRNKSITWKVVERSTPDHSSDVSEARDLLQNQVGLIKRFEFLKEFGYEQKTSRASCSMSCTSSYAAENKVQSLKDSTIFGKLFLKLMYKDWESKVQKMNSYIEEENKKIRNERLNNSISGIS